MTLDRFMAKRLGSPSGSVGTLVALLWNKRNAGLNSGHFKACTVDCTFYWKNVQQALCELQRVWTEGGKWVMCFTCKAFGEERGFAKHISLDEAADVRQTMASCGFQGIRPRLFSDRQSSCV